MGKKLSKLLGVFCVGLLFALCGITAGASANETLTEVPYLDENGNSVTTEADVPVTVVTENMTEWTDGWYVINNDVTIDSSVNVTGNVCLILCNQTSSKVDGIIVPEGGTLTIYSQSMTDWMRGHLHTYIQGEGGDFNKGNVAIYGGHVYGEIRADNLIVQNSSIDLNSIEDGIQENIYANSVKVVSGSIGSLDSAICADTINISQDSIVNAEVCPGFTGNPTTITISDSSVSGEVWGTGEGSITIENSTIYNGDISGTQVSVTRSEISGNVQSDVFTATGSTITGNINSPEQLGLSNNRVTLDNTITQSVWGTYLAIKNNSRVQGNINEGATNSVFYSEVSVTSSNIAGTVEGTYVTVNSGYLSNSVTGEVGITINGGTFDGEVKSRDFTIKDGVFNNTVGPYGDFGCSVTIESGTFHNFITCDSITIKGGDVSYVNCHYATIRGGSINQLGLTSSASVYEGTIRTLWITEGTGIHLTIYGGTFINTPSLYNSVIWDYTGNAFGDDYIPYGALYLYKDGDAMKGIAGGVAGGGFYDPPLTIEEGWELVVLPGAELEGRLNNNGVIVVYGRIGEVTGNPPYYAINADAETVSGVSATGAIVRDGVTFAQPDALVTLTPKESGSVRWAVEPAALTVQNNKFYMPDEVVSVKASALPLEATPAIQVNGEKLTGFTAGEYYSISDAIFRPTGTTLPVRPEWYGTTVSIVKLGDGFATGDSFAQALAIPSQYSGTVTPPNPGGGTGSKPDPDDPEEIVIPDGDWEEAEEELSQADSGDTVIVETDEDDALPDEVLESAAGKNVTLIIQVGTIVSWEIDCREIPKAASLQDISLKVSMNTQGIPSKVLCGLPGSHTFLQMTLGHDGLFGFPVKLHADVGRGNSDKWANLYYYNEGTGKMEFETAARVTASGDAAFTMTHASQYAIVLDEKSHTLSFQDVKEGSWFQDAVEYVYRAGLMAGTGDTTFEPNAKLTRAMTAQILYNLEGQPEVTGEATFSDMNTAPDWSMDAIAWAQDTGVVAGMGDNTFAPNLKVTREQFSQMLYNYAKYKKCDLTKAGDLTKFPDEGSVSDWAVTALSWANGNGLINGHENGTLDPHGNTVRGQAASILMNFDLNVVKSVA